MSILVPGFEKIPREYPNDKDFVSSSFTSRVVVESDFLNAISWVSSLILFPWRFQFYLNEIKALSSSIYMDFQHVGRGQPMVLQTP